MRGGDGEKTARRTEEVEADGGAGGGARGRKGHDRPSTHIHPQGATGIISTKNLYIQVSSESL